MKRILIIAFVIILLGANASSSQIGKMEFKGTISISGAWALYPMALRWAEEFEKLHPGVRIDVQAGGAGKGIADVLAGLVDIGMVSRGIHPSEVSRGAFAIAVTKDAVVPTASEKNPFLNKLLERGLRREEFSDIWITAKIMTWGEILGVKDKAALHVYTRSDACGAAETWAEFLGKRQEDLQGVGVYGDPGLADAVRRDALGIGFNNINYAYDAKTKKPIKGIVILPLDLNGNGKIDDSERIYASRDEITQAIANDIYPSPPARDLYFVTSGKPTKRVLIEFIKWVLSEGQKFVSETGYITLSQEKLAQGIEKISN